MTDNQREAMYYASLKNRLVHYKEEKKTVPVNFTFEEFKEIMLNKSPTAIYHTQYSEKEPCWNITKTIMPSHGGVYIYADSAADKTPKFMDWESFYKMLLYQGLEYIKF